MPKKIKLDKHDFAIMNILQNNATITNKDLAKRIGLSPPATMMRVIQLREKDYLLRSGFELNWTKLGYKYEMLIHVEIHLEREKEFKRYVNSNTNLNASFKIAIKHFCKTIESNYHYILSCKFKNLVSIQSFRNELGSQAFVITFKMFEILTITRQPIELSI